MDVARILCRTPEELYQTDIADYALEALRHSKIKNVYVMGRRGPAQAAFTTPEIKELGEMEDTDAYVLAEEAELDELSQEALADSSDRATMKKIEIIQSYAGREASGKSRRLTVRFLVSPLELIDDGQGNVAGMRLVKNELYATDAGTLRPRATAEIEELPVTLVFRAIGYRGVPIPDVPFYDSWGVILNKEGRIIDPDTQEPVLGEYTGGWIKRGPSGVIGTNKPDALETVKHMLEDVAAGAVLSPEHTDPEEVVTFVADRQPEFFTYADWLRLDELELANGAAQGRPRVKFTSVDNMLRALGREPV
jgi:ferredoxin--NADP+ reductase